MEINALLRKEILKSIEECDKHTEIRGSTDFYDSLIAKYSALDKSFVEGLPRNGKLYVGSEADYRPEIKAVSEKLKMLLIVNSTQDDIKRQELINKINDLISTGEKVLKEEADDELAEVFGVYIVGPQYNSWLLEVEIFNERYLRPHQLYTKIRDKYINKKSSYADVECLINCLKVITKDTELLSNINIVQTQNSNLSLNMQNQRKTIGKQHKSIFLVHGHDNEMKQDVARFLEKAKLTVVILHEQPNGGLTIIEKLEKYTDVSFAIVLYSPCDVGRSKKAKPEDEKPRARQNVVFEHGYLNGRLGRDRVCALLKDDVEKPSDIEGVLYIPMDNPGAWKSEVAREMKKAGLDFNLEALIY